MDTKTDMLIVSKDHKLSKSMENYFPQNKLSKTTCTSVDTALTTLKSQEFKLLIIGININETEGINADQLLRSIPNNKKPKQTIIMSDSHFSTDMRSHLISLGVARFFQKPLKNISEFKSFIETALEHDTGYKDIESEHGNVLQ